MPDWSSLSLRLAERPLKFLFFMKNKMLKEKKWCLLQHYPHTWARHVKAPYLCLAHKHDLVELFTF